MSEIIIATSDSKENYRISKLRKAKKLRKIAPRIYSADLDSKPSEIIARNILEILGRLYPGALLSHRSAFEFTLTSSHHIFVTHKYTKKVKLPGVTINFLKGKGQVEGDNQQLWGMFVSSKERAFLENLQSTKKIGPDSKCLGIPQIEEKLDDILRIKGEEGLNLVRDKARAIAKALGMKKEMMLLDKMIGALLSTKPSSLLKSNLALSRAAGMPYDKVRVELFHTLFTFLHNQEFKDRAEENSTVQSFRNFAFFEAYFSNYIEGTVFEVDEAKRIVDTGVPLATRDGDSHDVLGTYQLVSDTKGLKNIPGSANEFLTLLQTRHGQLLSARIDKHPGQFKERNNRAGSTQFVDWKLVRGTLIRAFEFYQALQHPFARAAYMMFVVSEVHPFEDGNGRIARVMMNAELVAAEQSKIIIPTVFRDDYMLTIKKMTKRQDPKPFIDMLTKAHEFSHVLHFEAYDDLYEYLKSHNAFYEPDEGRYLIVD
ncbi:MAG: Fic family protein [Bacteroidota bacterium]